MLRSSETVGVGTFACVGSLTHPTIYIPMTCAFKANVRQFVLVNRMIILCDIVILRSIYNISVGQNNIHTYYCSDLSPHIILENTQFSKEFKYHVC